MAKEKSQRHRDSTVDACYRSGLATNVSDDPKSCTAGGCVKVGGSVAKGDAYSCLEACRSTTDSHWAGRRKGTMHNLCPRTQCRAVAYGTSCCKVQKVLHLRKHLSHCPVITYCCYRCTHQRRLQVCPSPSRCRYRRYPVG